MSNRLILQKAQKQFKNRKYSRVIALLEPYVIEFRDTFEVFYMLGVSCMYSNDTGGAQSYFQRARQLKMRDTNLLLSQAALYLRRGDTNQALEYYLEVLDYDPRNKIARDAMNFIRTMADKDIISQWVSNGKIKRFYPSAGFVFPVVPVVAVLAVALVVAGFILVRQGAFKKAVPQRSDLSDFVLSVSEKKNPQQSDTSGVFRYILTADQITSSYALAQKYFQKYRDNAAQIEINRILNSNASASIKQKSRLLMEYFAVPAFDSLKDNIEYTEVAKDPYLYLDCWVIWSGRVTNVMATDSIYDCELLVGFDTMNRIEGIVPLSIPQPVAINVEKPVKVLGKLGIKNNKLFLQGRTVYQPVAAEK